MTFVSVFGALGSEMFSHVEAGTDRSETSRTRKVKHSENCVICLLIQPLRVWIRVWCRAYTSLYSSAFLIRFKLWNIQFSPNGNGSSIVTVLGMCYTLTGCGRVRVWVDCKASAEGGSCAAMLFWQIIAHLSSGLIALDETRTAGCRDEPSQRNDSIGWRIRYLKCRIMFIFPSQAPLMVMTDWLFQINALGWSPEGFCDWWRILECEVFFCVHQGAS